MKPAASKTSFVSRLSFSSMKMLSFVRAKQHVYNQAYPFLHYPRNNYTHTRTKEKGGVSYNSEYTLPLSIAAGPNRVKH